MIQDSGCWRAAVASIERVTGLQPSAARRCWRCHSSRGSCRPCGKRGWRQNGSCGTPDLRPGRRPDFMAGLPTGSPGPQRRRVQLTPGSPRSATAKIKEFFVLYHSNSPRCFSHLCALPWPQKGSTNFTLFFPSPDRLPCDSPCPYTSSPCSAGFKSTSPSLLTS